MSKNNFIRCSLQTMTLVVVGMVLFLFNACTQEPVTSDNCTITISSFNVSPTTFAAGDALTGSILFADKVGLDALSARSVTELYLSSDDTYSANDSQLDAFTDPASANGTNYTVTFNQIEIPFGIAAGSYYIIARIASQPCTGGESSDVATRSKAVTVN